jgi:hypothetical protein
MIKKYETISSWSVQNELFQDSQKTHDVNLHKQVSNADISLIPLIGISDKYLLSSAFHKSIRRGLAVQSIAIAVRLHQVDPSYLKRRLPIIALEDIGLGDIQVCHDVLVLCSSFKWWGAEVTRTISYLASSMANAVKSRSACDLFCLTEVHLDRSLHLPRLLKCDASTLINIACDRGMQQMERLYALRVLGGITSKENGFYETFSQCNLDALDAIGVALKLPAIIRWLMGQQRKTAGMAAMLPIVYEATQNAVICKGREFPRAMDIIAGLPLCTLDMYTQLGKIALRRLYQSSNTLQDFSLQHVPRCNPQPLINLAMFQTESALLDRYLSSPELDELSEETEEAEMYYLGMVEPTNRKQLYCLLKERAGRLATIRMDSLEKLITN